MDPQQTGSSEPGRFKPQTPRPPLPRAGYVPVTRRYPKPPPLLQRLVLLCIRPESWAETARYPTYVTLLPLLLAILISAVAVGWGQTTRAASAARALASSFDDGTYPALELHSDATLSAKGPLPRPIRSEFLDVPLYIDPSGTTRPESIKHEGMPGTDVCFVVTDKDVVLSSNSGPFWHVPLAGLVQFPLMVNLPAAGESKLIDGPALRAFLENRPELYPMGILFLLIMHALKDALWAILMMFLLTPLIRAVVAGPRPAEGPDRRLILPRRAAYRMIAGLSIPIICADGILLASGHSIQSTLGDLTFAFWFSAAAALGVWTAVLARGMYITQAKGKRPRGT